MEMDKFLILFMLFSFSKMITISNTKDSKDIKKLEGNLLYYYINDDNSKVQNVLKQILLLDENVYKRDYEIMKYWEYIDNQMILNENVAPDGLPKTNTHAFVVLGYQLNNDGSLRPEAKGRCDVAFESAKKYPNSKIYLTGGGTAKNNPNVTEAGQMRDYLVNVKGLKKNRIITEEKAMDTIQNAKNTINQLYADNIKRITIITSDYHIRRGNILFKGVSMVVAESLKKTPIDILQNAVWETGKATEGKLFEGYALASILNVSITVEQAFKTLIKCSGDILNYFLN